VTSKPFHYRILLVDDEPSIRQLGSALLETQGYEVHVAEDGFDALASLKQSLPDIIISDLRMPNMNGFEFLSVVRQKFPHIPVIAISGEFSPGTVPESVLADAFFAKGQYRPSELFERIAALLDELPTRPRIGKTNKAAVWVNNTKGGVVVTCTHCLRTFPATKPVLGINEISCDFCSTPVRFELTEEIADSQFSD
jgi:CheY-like chemotaxis protein